MVGYVKAEEAAYRSVIYIDSSGKYFRYSGGTRAWRNHNPGNIHPGSVSKRNNQIGTAGRCAVFPDAETGHRALIDSLTTTHKNRSINQLVEKYAPGKDGNDVKAYKKFLHDQTGIYDDKKIKDFTKGEFEKLWHAIERMEGSMPGTVVEVYEIIQVRRNKSGFCGFNIRGKWATKDECINLAREGRLDVIVCVSLLGHSYIRARVGSSINDNLTKLVVKNSKNEP